MINTSLLLSILLNLTEAEINISSFAKFLHNLTGKIITIEALFSAKHSAESHIQSRIIFKFNLQYNNQWASQKQPCRLGQLFMDKSTSNNDAAKKKQCIEECKKAKWKQCIGLNAPFPRVSQIQTLQQNPIPHNNGIIDELINHVKSFTIDTFKNFPLKDEDEFSYSEEVQSDSTRVRKDIS